VPWGKKFKMLKEIFVQLVQKYSEDTSMIDLWWKEIQKSYGESGRHYHTLAHLENLYRQLMSVKNEIEDFDTMLWSMFYHDIVYGATKSDNEEKSAKVAVERLKSIVYPAKLIEKCERQILATKGHSISLESDTNIFTDADLSILGQPWEIYSNYFKQVRKEYSIYPDFIYNDGRKKVLNHFLKMDRIFKTKTFFERLEGVARGNIRGEMELL
jgi:predicted metal-dependent HD superfamily phosphohydrolase